MMGRQGPDQGKLFYEFRLEDRIPENHLLRRGWESFYSDIGRPSVAPELMIRMLVVGYCYGIRSERRLTQQVELHLAYAILQARPRRRDPASLDVLARPPGPLQGSDVLRHIFERVIWTAMAMAS
jgi:transposase